MDKIPFYRENYPRPQFVRENWTDLNGSWHFAFDDHNTILASNGSVHPPCDRMINVPFSYETVRSGIGDETAHPVVWYRRSLDVHPEPGTRLLLHLEGADYRTQVWGNGVYLGENIGGYHRCTFDLTAALSQERGLDLVIRVEDTFDEGQPRGKQRWRQASWGCWYVQTTGIWKSVWLERVPETYLLSVDCVPDAERGAVTFFPELNIPDPAGWALQIVIADEGRPVCTDCQPIPHNGCPITVQLPENIRLWSPEEPNLYTVRYTLLKDGVPGDEVDSYFGFRSIAVQDGRLLLNGKPLYLRMVLDQGYWPESGLTPPDEEALKRDIDLTLRLGYNGARKHQKIEDERYLFWADVKGLLVWSEMAAAYRYHGRAAEAFTEEWTRVVRQNKNHPSIIAWVPFNESWGVPEIGTNRAQQHFVNAIYHLTHALDGTRPVITNDGWEHTLSDIVTIHAYREDGAALARDLLENGEALLQNRYLYNDCNRKLFAEGYGYHGQPVMLSEYGGIALQNGAGWGYGTQAADEEVFLQRLLSQNQVISQTPYLSGFCITQLTDVQQEVNGLLDPERKSKISPEAEARLRASNLAVFQGRE